MAQQIAAPPTVVKKRGRGRPKNAESSVVPLLQEGTTKAERIQLLFNKWYGCRKCELCNYRDERAADNVDDICFGEGNPDAHCVIVGEGPGEEEEAHSIPFIGRSGMLLNQILASTSDNLEIRASHVEYGRLPRRETKAIDQSVRKFNEYWVNWRHTEFFVTNAVACRPPENRTPNYAEIKACWERLWNLIYIIDPMVIIACGNSALSALMQKVSVQISKMRGSVIDISHNGWMGKVSYPVIPVYHPSYLLRKADWDQKGGDFEKTVEDVRKGLRLMDFLRNQHYGTPIPNR